MVLDSTSEVIHLGSWNLKLVDESIRQARFQQEYHKDRDFLQDLPETEFYEGDEVKCQSDSRYSSYFVVGIEYHNIGQFCNDGVTPMPLYRISDKFYGHGWHTSPRNNEMSLVKRGNVWKYFHNEKPIFENLEEEARFFELLGHTQEVRNPIYDLYKWNLQEALDAIKSGLGDVIKGNGGLFGSSPSITVIKFNDRELGKRIAKLTLQNFVNFK